MSGMFGSCCIALKSSLFLHRDGNRGLLPTIHDHDNVASSKASVGGAKSVAHAAGPRHSPIPTSGQPCFPVNEHGQRKHAAGPTA